MPQDEVPFNVSVTLFLLHQVDEVREDLVFFVVTEPLCVLPWIKRCYREAMCALLAVEIAIKLPPVLVAEEARLNEP